MIVWACGLGAAWGAATPEGLRVDSYAAIVNDQIITVGDVLILVQPVEAQLRTAYEGRELEDRLQKAFRDGLEALIERALILEEFKAMGGNLPDRAVEDNINEIIHDRFNNDRVAFLAALADDHMTFDDWREEMKNRLVVSIMRRREVADKVVVAPADIQAEYEQNLDRFRTPEKVKLSAIVLQKGADEKEAAVKLEEAQRLHTQLLEGEDFAVLAANASEGPKAQQGGDLGWMIPAEMLEELAAAVQKLQPGQVSEVLPIGQEYYIVKLEARQNAAVKPFEDVRADIEKTLRDRQVELLTTTWMARLREKYFVKIFEEALE